MAGSGLQRGQSNSYGSGGGGDRGVSLTNSGGGGSTGNRASNGSYVSGASNTGNNNGASRYKGYDSGPQFPRGPSSGIVYTKEIDIRKLGGRGGGCGGGGC